MTAARGSHEGHMTTARGSHEGHMTTARGSHDHYWGGGLLMEGLHAVCT